jgi:hypothetical protein
VETSKGRTIAFFRENDVIAKVADLLNGMVSYFVANKKINIHRELADEPLILAIDKKAKEGVDIPGIKDVVLTYSTKQIQQPEGRAREDDFRLWFFVHNHRMHENHWAVSKKWAEIRSDHKYIEKEIELSEDYTTMLQSVTDTHTEEASSSA